MKVVIEFDPLGEKRQAIHLADTISGILLGDVELREVHALNSSQPEPHIAVLCRNRREFLQWCTDNPTVAGKAYRATCRAANAFPVTCETDAIGRNIDQVVRFGTWRNLPHLQELEATLRRCLISSQIHNRVAADVMQVEARA